MNLTPKNISIDATKPYTFTWRSTGAPQTGYQIIIRKNDNDSLVYNSYKIQSTTSLHYLPKNTLQNGINYKWQVQAWNDIDSAVSDWVYLSANTTPVLAFSTPLFNTPVYLNSQDFIFRVNYIQAESVSIKKYRFILYDIDDDIIHDSDWIYDINLEYKTTGMIRTNSYKIECQAYDQNDMFATTGRKEFAIVDYLLPEGTPELQVIDMDDLGSAEINWITQIAVAKVQDTNGIEKTPKYINNIFNKGLELNANEEVAFTRPVTTNYNLSFHTYVTYGLSGDFVEFDNGVSLGYDALTLRFYINNNGEYKYSNPVTIYTFEDFTEPWTAYTKPWVDPSNFDLDEYIKNPLFVSMNDDDFVIRIGDTIIAESTEPEPEPEPEIEE